MITKIYKQTLEADFDWSMTMYSSRFDIHDFKNHICTIDSQHGKPTLWYFTDGSAEDFEIDIQEDPALEATASENGFNKFEILAVGTGWNLDLDNFEYLGTFVDGSFVYHYVVHQVFD